MTLLAEIHERWDRLGSEGQCEHWWYAAVRHVQRNLDLDLDCDCGLDEPDRYDGPAYAHAKADIAYLLSLVEGGTDAEA